MAQPFDYTVVLEASHRPAPARVIRNVQEELAEAELAAEVHREQVADRVAEYATHSAHARHLASEAGLSAKDLPHGYSKDGWDHAQAPRDFTPTAHHATQHEPSDTAPQRRRGREVVDCNDEEIEL